MSKLCVVVGVVGKKKKLLPSPPNGIAFEDDAPPTIRRGQDRMSKSLSILRTDASRAHIIVHSLDAHKEIVTQRAKRNPQGSHPVFTNTASSVSTWQL